MVGNLFSKKFGRNYFLLKIWLEIFLGQKIFWSKKFLGPKKIWSEYFLAIKNWAQKFFWQKYLLRIFFGQHKFGFKFFKARLFFLLFVPGPSFSIILWENSLISIAPKIISTLVLKWQSIHAFRTNVYSTPRPPFNW